MQRLLCFRWQLGTDTDACLVCTALLWRSWVQSLPIAWPYGAAVWKVGLIIAPATFLFLIFYILWGFFVPGLQTGIYLDHAELIKTNEWSPPGKCVPVGNWPPSSRALAPGKWLFFLPVIRNWIPVTVLWGAETEITVCSPEWCPNSRLWTWVICAWLILVQLSRASSSVHLNASGTQRYFFPVVNQAFHLVH